ncbi:MAG TPA: ricin-type beta-trefoil lectin domain protein, partial [Streptosporangiaceae bacterium]|nr:ricin-type beta-trefoil lectin domain protein [Streptosporangiaceae bacterium]
MRRTLAALSAAGVVVAAAAAGLGGTAGAAAAGTVSRQPVPLHRVNLHTSIAPMLAHTGHGPIKYHPVAHSGPRRESAATAAACTEPNCPVTYHGGSVQHTPHVYLLLWGPNWSPTGSDTEYLDGFYSGLGGSKDTWSPVLTQYGDSSGPPSFSGTLFEGVWNDASTPPPDVTPDDLAAEAGDFAQTVGITDFADTQVVVVSQSGTCFSDGWGGQPSSCADQPAKQYCSWHSYATNSSTGAELPFVNMPYQPDAGAGCGENFVNSGSAGTYDGFSMTAGHEFAEVTTDPFPATGWVDTSDNVSGGEVADKCAFGGKQWGTPDPYGDVTFSTGTFAMQSLWSNAAGGCVMSQAVGASGAITGYAGVCMDNYQSSGFNGAKVGISSCDGSPAQKWTLTSSGELVNAASGKCLNDAGYGGQGAKLIQWTCSTSYSNELWTHEPGGQYKLAANGLCLNDPGYSTVNGTQLILWACGNYANERWTLPGGSLTGAITGYGSTCVDNYRSSTANGAKVDIYSCNGSAAQKWTLTSSGELVNAASGKCLNDAGYGGQGAKLIQWTCSTSYSNEL